MRAAQRAGLQAERSGPGCWRQQEEPRAAQAGPEATAAPSMSLVVQETSQTPLNHLRVGSYLRVYHMLAFLTEAPPQQVRRERHLLCSWCRHRARGWRAHLLTPAAPLSILSFTSSSRTQRRRWAACALPTAGAAPACAAGAAATAGRDVGCAAGQELLCRRDGARRCRGQPGGIAPRPLEGHGQRVGPGPQQRLQGSRCIITGYGFIPDTYYHARMARHTS